MKKPAPKKKASKPKEYPYLGTCRFCGQGLLRVWRSRAEDKTVVVCGECELVWDDAAALCQKPKTKATGNFSALASAAKTRGKATWVRATAKEVEKLGLEQFVQGSCE